MIFDTPAMTVVEDASTEGTLSSLTVIKETNSINDIKDKTKWMKYDLTKVPAFSSGISLVSLPNNSVLIVGAPFFSTKNIFSIIDYKNQKVTPLKYWPNDGVKCASHPKRRVYTDDALLYGIHDFLFYCHDVLMQEMMNRHQIFAKLRLFSHTAKKTRQGGPKIM